MSTEPPERTPLPDAVRRNLRLFVVLLILTAVLYLLSIPLAYGVLITSPLAIALGLKALYDTRKEAGFTFHRMAIIVGTLMAGMSILLGLGLVIFRDMVVELDTCLERAVTQQARTACQNTYEERYREVLDGLVDRLP